MVLEAAQALTCSPDCGIAVATATCMKACNKVPLDGMAVFVNGRQELLSPAFDQATALAIAYDALGAPAELHILRGAIASKIAGDAAVERGALEEAVAAYSSALDALPSSGFLAVEQQAASAAASGPQSAPPRLDGLGPARLAKELAKERERTMPGRVRWIFEALIGRARAHTGLGMHAQALADARDATLLCPLAPAGYETLRDAATAEGETSLAAEAEAQAASLRPQGMGEAAHLLLRANERQAKQATATTPSKAADRRSAVGAAYVLAIGGVISAIAYRKTPGNEVKSRYM